MREHLLQLQAQLRVNVLAYDYSGYGLSSGSPSASNCQADVEAVYAYVRQQQPLACRRIVLYGQSLGSGPSLHLASRRPVSGLVIHSGLLSCLRVLDPALPSTPFYDLFPNIDLAPCLLHEPPVLVIHGAADSEITPVHAERLYDGVRCKYGLWLASGCGHNDVEVKQRAEYWQRLSAFLSWLQTAVPELQLVEAEAAKRREQERQRRARERRHWWR